MYGKLFQTTNTLLFHLFSQKSGCCLEQFFFCFARNILFPSFKKRIAPQTSPAEMIRLGNQAVFPHLPPKQLTAVIAEQSSFSAQSFLPEPGNSSQQFLFRHTGSRNHTVTVADKNQLCRCFMEDFGILSQRKKVLQLGEYFLKDNFSIVVKISRGSPSRMRSVRRISFGITTSQVIQSFLQYQLLSYQNLLIHFYDFCCTVIVCRIWENMHNLFSINSL